jgi:hypothetical protein
MKLAAKIRLRYGGRSLQPGDAFEASTSDARILKAIGKAVDYVDPEIAEREALRECAAALGIEVDGRWGVGRLAQEVADAESRRRSYHRRDMVAEDSK